MTAYTVHKGTAVPSSFGANEIWLVTDQTDTNLLSVYVSNQTGAAMRHTITKAEVQGLIDATVSGLSLLQIVADITERDALSLTANALVLVEDASADGTVDSGAALYSYKHATTTFNKISEYESLDVVLNWSNIVGAPSSSPAAIDTAVANSHTHSNKTQIDKIGEDGDSNPTYAGTNLVMQGATNW